MAANLRSRGYVQFGKPRIFDNVKLKHYTVYCKCDLTTPNPMTCTKYLYFRDVQINGPNIVGYWMFSIIMEYTNINSRGAMTNTYTIL